MELGTICPVSYLGQIEQLTRTIKEVDAILIGAGRGLPSSAGLFYFGERFESMFGDFIEAYGLEDMNHAVNYTFPNLETHWAYWSRHIYSNRYKTFVGDAYKVLFDLVKDKDYFVITTNVERNFQRFGFDKDRIFYAEGDYGLWQCSVPCNSVTYDNKRMVYRMVLEQKDLKIPSELVPYCKDCGAPLIMNLKRDETFVYPEDWYEAKGNYEMFLLLTGTKKVLYLDLGVGLCNPNVIKYSFWNFAKLNPQSLYATINLNPIMPPEDIRDRSFVIAHDITEVLHDIQNHM